MDNTAWTRLLTLQTHPPAACDEGVVAEFHEIVTALEEAYGDLSGFRISDAKLQPRLVSTTRIPRSGRFPAGAQVSDKRYCDEQLFRRQVDGLVAYLQPQPPEPRKVGF
jgi:hypothetical protein